MSLLRFSPMRALAVFLAFPLSASLAFAQHVFPSRPAPAIDGADREALQWLAQRAPVLFVGEVVPVGLSENASELPVIRLQIEHGIRGVRDGDVFSLRQWPGSDGLALAPHERVVLFLRQPNAAGLTSSAFGSFGVLRIGGGDLVNIRPLATLAHQLGQGMSGPATAGNSTAFGPGCPFGPTHLLVCAPATHPRRPADASATVPTQQFVQLLTALIRSHPRQTQAVAEVRDAQ